MESNSTLDARMTGGLTTVTLRLTPRPAPTMSAPTIGWPAEPDVA
jgi:hypothetical protein